MHYFFPLKCGGKLKKKPEMISFFLEVFIKSCKKTIFSMILKESRNVMARSQKALDHARKKRTHSDIMLDLSLLP